MKFAINRDLLRELRRYRKARSDYDAARAADTVVAYWSAMTVAAKREVMPHIEAEYLGAWERIWGGKWAAPRA